MNIEKPTSSLKVTLSAFAASLWGLGLLIHASLIVTAIATFFYSPEFSINVGEQAQNTLSVIEKNEQENSLSELREYVYLLTEKKNRLKWDSYSQQIAIDNKIKEANEVAENTYESIIKEKCPDCDLWVSSYSLYKGAYEIGSIANVKKELNTIRTLSKERMMFWIAVGKLAHAIVIAVLVLLVAIFWKSKTQGFLNWFEKFLFLFSPLLLATVVTVMTLSSLSNYSEYSAIPFPKSGEFFVWVTVIGVIGLFVLTPVAGVIRKHRKASVHE